jgi:MFS family permease
MGDANSRSDAPDPADGAVTGSVLDRRLRNRNILIFSALISLTYLASPALNVDIVEAALCKRLHTSDTVANLPGTVFLGMAWFPVLVAWLAPQARLLKVMMSLTYVMMGLMCAVLAAVIMAQAPERVIVATLIVHGAVQGCASGVVGILIWEALGRGIPERLRGRTLGIAYGWGPGFAVAASLGTQLLLDGNFFGWRPPSWMAVIFPYNYAILFGGSALCMFLNAFLLRFYRISLPKVEVARESFSKAIVGGFKAIFSYRVLLISCVAYLLVYCGNMVQINMSIFTKEAIGRAPEDLAGYELALRFAFKMLAGFLLGWLLTRTNPKIPLIVTVGLEIAGVLWVLMVPGYWFLLAFGLNGAGELFGLYYLNYPVCCSPKSQVRRNMAFLNLLATPVALSPVLYGWIADTWSLRASFWTALAILVFTTVLVVAKLPAHPRPTRPRPVRRRPCGGGVA